MKNNCKTPLYNVYKKGMYQDTLNSKASVSKDLSSQDYFLPIVT